MTLEGAREVGCRGAGQRDKSEAVLLKQHGAMEVTWLQSIH